MEEREILESLDASGELSEFVKSKKWTLVTDVCNRRLKKSNNGDAVKALRIISLSLEQKSSRRDQATHELRDLLERNPPVSDPAALTLLEALCQSRVHHASASDPLERIWSRAATSITGNNAWIYKAWYETKLRKGRLQAAKQAAMAWMKAFPKDHDPFYLFIFVNDLISRLVETPVAESRLSQMLASKALATAASDTALDKGHQSGRVLTTQNDLGLLLLVLKHQEKAREALEVLKAPKTTVKSLAGTHTWELLLVQLELQALCDEWESAWLSCQQILQASRPEKFKEADVNGICSFGPRGDDWKIWDMLMLATGKLSQTQSDIVAKTEQLVIDFSVPRSRNASLALLKLHSRYLRDPTSKKLLKKCQKYFEDNNTKSACLRDLGPHLAGLSRSHQEMLINNITRRNEEDRKQAPQSKTESINLIISRVNALRLDYGLLVSRLTGEAQSKALTKLVGACLRLYDASLLLDLQLAQGDSGPADEAVLLAATALIRLYHLGQRNGVLRSIAVLEILLRTTRVHYEALLLVIQLYLYLGTGSLALDRYLRLSVKNIQHASMTWLLFPRLSKIHPWPVALPLASNATTSFDPNEEIKTGLRWYESASKLMGKELDRLLRGSRFETAFGLLETQENVQSGASRLFLHIEALNMQYLRPELSIPPTVLSEFPKKVHDNRDRGAIPTYETTPLTPSVSRIPSATPRLKSGRCWLVDDLKFTFGHRSSNDEQNVTRDDSQALEDDLQADIFGSTTPLQITTVKIYKTLEEIVILSGTASVSHILDKRVEKLLKQLQTLKSHCQKLKAGNGPSFGDMRLGEGFHIPLWSTFHGLFTLISVANTVQEVVRKTLRRAEVAKDRQVSYRTNLDAVESTCQQIKDTIQGWSQCERERAGSEDFRASVNLKIFGDAGDELGAWIARSFGQEAAQGYLTSLCESYVDAYDGVIKSSAV